MAQREIISLAVAQADRDRDQRRAQGIRCLRTRSFYKCFSIERNELRLARTLENVRQTFESVDRDVVEDLLRLFLDRSLDSDVPRQCVKLQIDVEVAQSLVIRILYSQRVEI